MNPFLLLLGLVSVSGLGSLKKDAGVTGNTSKKGEETVPQDEPTDTTGTTETPETVTPPAEPSVEEDPVAPPVTETSEDPPVVQNPTPEAPDQTGTGGDGATTTPMIADGTVEVMAGRVATLQAAGDDIQSVKILSGVDHGNITVNPDGTFALVMTLSDFTGSQAFTYEATHLDGSVTTHTVGLDVVPGVQLGGWGTGEHHYMLATDENDRVIVEHGDTHTKVYVSGSDSALSLADIAAQEGLSLSQITGSWLAASGYGQSEDLALNEDAATLLWKAVTPKFSETSNWLLFERGYEYGDFAYDEGIDSHRLLERGADGESELHPLYIGAWGEGAAPEITGRFMQFQESTSNVVIQDLHFSGSLRWLNGENTLFENITVTDGEMSIQGLEGVTIRNSAIYDVYREASLDGGDWEAHGDRISGLYADYVDGFLLENSFIDHNGWADGYDFYGSGDAGQAPSMYSQNIYLNFRTTDVTMRDTITMRAASFGAQVRAGGFIEDVVFLDNNAAFITTGGDRGDDVFSGQYTLMTDSLITSAGHKEATQIGAKSSGLMDRGEMSSLVDNIIAHLADPNNPDEFAQKTSSGPSVETTTSYFENSTIWNWIGSGPIWSERLSEQNVEGLDTNVLDETTIQRFTQQLLGDPNAGISDLANYLRAQADGALDNLVDADLIIRFFQEGFGIAPDIRGTATTLRFVPDDLGEGVRWDNRLNWDTEDLPGTQDGDSVDLGGNHVVFGTNTRIDTLEFGDGGSLNVYGGRLGIEGGITGEGTGLLNLEGAGQVWTNGNDSELYVTVNGGRFANTGLMENTDLGAAQGQTILATGGAEFDLGTSKTLAIFAEAAKVGFDGDDGGIAILDMHDGSRLSYSASDGGLGTIEEFRSGAFGDAPDVQSGIDLGGSTLEIDLTGLSADAGTAFTLMDSDELVGIFDSADVGGLGARDAKIVIDYLNDSVTLQLTAGSGLVSVETLGDETDHEAEEDALWQALTADQGLAEDAEIPVDEEIEEILAA